MSDQTSLELRRQATELVRQARNESGMEFLDRLLQHPQVEELLTALEPHEFYSLVLSVGKSDSYDLIRYASQEQLQAIVDLDLWVSGTFSPERFEQLLGIAATAGEETVANLIESLEDNQLGIYLLRRCTVMARTMDPDQEDSIADMGQTILTPDNLFYLILPAGNTWYGTLKSFIEAAYYIDRQRTVELLSSCTGEDAQILEEEEKRARDSRMTTMGFPSLEEAEHLFHYVNPIKTREAIRSKLDHLAEMPYPGDTLLPALLKLDVKQPAFLGRVMQRTMELGLPTDRVLRSMVSLGNHIIMWETKDNLADADTTAHGLQRALRLLSLGLEYVAEEDVEIGVQVLRRVKATTLFRIAYSLTMWVREKARKLASLAGQESGFFLFDPPLDDTIKGAAQFLPMYFEGLVDDDRNTLKDFETLAELRKTRAALKQAEGVDMFVRQALRLDVKALELQVEKDLRPMVTHTTLMATALVNGLLGVEPWLKPVPAQDLPKIVDLLLLPTPTGERLLNPKFQQAVEKFFHTEKNRFAGALMDLSVKKLDVVFRRLPKGMIPEAKLLADTLLVGRM